MNKEDYKALVKKHTPKEPKLRNFGVAFLGISNFDVKNYEPLEVQEGPEPINYDDVIDAHRFIKNLDADWQKHLPQ